MAVAEEAAALMVNPEAKLSFSKLIIICLSHYSIAIRYLSFPSLHVELQLYSIILLQLLPFFCMELERDLFLYSLQMNFSLHIPAYFVHCW
ncbi:uncharacterized protein G2W53_006204 [Senna tora]|uniref:Uncharacterized protein n=1 Tax=Senna tora TaxID=362788 RepID=A0A835CG88_9FABA|nr:uncharacterized protein G2W53_006204 [Senna tora]